MVKHITKSKHKIAFEKFILDLETEVQNYVETAYTDLDSRSNAPFEFKTVKSEYRHNFEKKATSDIYKLNMYSLGKKKPLETLVDVRFNDYHSIVHVSVPKQEVYRRIKGLVNNLKREVKVEVFDTLPYFNPYGSQSI